MGSTLGIEQTTFAPGLLRHLRRAKVDILHVQEPHVARITQWAERRGWVGTRTIIGDGTELSLTEMDRFTYLQHLAPWHLEHARASGVFKPTWTAIPNFINTDQFRPGRCASLRAELGIPQDGLVVLTAAAIQRHHKRVDYLLDEFASLLRTDTRMALA